jgi:hypothetical protein
LIGVGLVLIRRRYSVWDGRFLVFLEVLFIVDAKFIVTEAAATDHGLGTVVGIASLLGAIMKLVVVTRVLGVRLGPWHWAVITVQIAAAIFIGSAFSALAVDGILNRPIAHGFWWLAAIALAIQPGVPLI